MSGTATIRKMYDEGKTVHEMVQHLSGHVRPRTYVSILRTLKAMHVPLKEMIDYDRPWTVDEIKILEGCIEQGKHIDVMRKNLFRNAESIRAKMKELHSGSEVKSEQIVQIERYQDALDFCLVAPWGAATERGNRIWGDNSMPPNGWPTQPYNLGDRA